MDNLSPSDMLKLLEDEAERLCQIEQKILDQLHHLQVEESVYTQAMNQLATEEASKDANDDQDDGEDTSFAEEIDRELAEALKATLEADKHLSKDASSKEVPIEESDKVESLELSR